VAPLDYSLPLLNGSEVTRQIRARLPRTEVLIFTVYESELVIEEALQAGARGYLLKCDANRYLFEAIASVAAHRLFFTSKVTEALLEGFLNRSDQPTFYTYKPRVRCGPVDRRGTLKQADWTPPQHQRRRPGNEVREGRKSVDQHPVGLSQLTT